MSRTLALSLVTLVSLLLAALPGALGGSMLAPEITDPSGDVDPLGLTGLKPEEASALNSNATMYDITAAFVTAESRSQFLLALQVVDLTGGVSDPDPSDPVPIPSTSVATYEVHFTTPAGDFTARAELDLWTNPADPTQPPIPYYNFTLHHADAAPGDDTWIRNLPGALDYRNHIVWYVVPKAAVGQPADGERLDKFWASAGHKAVVLDIAPNLDLLNADPTGLDPLNPGLPSNYGDPYVFGQYPGGPTSVVKIAAEGAASGTAALGETLDFYAKVENAGLTDDTFQISTRAPRGWSASAESATIDLASGSSAIIPITAKPAEDNARSGLLIVKATSLNTGQSREISIALTFDAPAGSGTGGSGSGSGGPNGPNGAPNQSVGSSDEKESPGLGLMVPALALLGLAVLARRRQA